VLDAAGVDAAVFAGTSMGGLYGLEAAAWYPDRVLGVVAIGTVAPFIGPVAPGESPFYDLFSAGSIAAYQQRTGLPGYREFVEAFMTAAITEPHRTKAIEDAVSFGLETGQEVLEATLAAPRGRQQGGVRGHLPAGALPGARRARRPGRDHPVRPRGPARRPAGRRDGHDRGWRARAVVR
jgi:pimeloyl-ACP methyl ester carboxylesterase